MCERCIQVRVCTHLAAVGSRAYHAGQREQLARRAELCTVSEVPRLALILHVNFTKTRTLVGAMQRRDMHQRATAA